MIKLLCIQDYFMEDGTRAFTQGRFYTFEFEDVRSMHTLDDEGVQHYMDIFEHLWDNFVPRNVSER